VDEPQDKWDGETCGQAIDGGVMWALRGGCAGRIFACFTIPLVLWFIVFSLATRRSPELVERLDWIPQSGRNRIRPEREARLKGQIRITRRIMNTDCGIQSSPESKDGKFGDILLADALTSYARVIGDLYISFCMFSDSAGTRGAIEGPDQNNEEDNEHGLRDPVQSLH
jgi:hypothetical protein